MLLSPWASSPYSNPFTGSFFPSFFFSSSFGVVLCSSNHTHTHTYYSICIYTWASYQFRSLRASRDFVRCSFMCMNWLCDSCFSRIALTFLCSLCFTLYVSRVQSIICPSKIRKKLFNTTLFLLLRRKGGLSISFATTNISMYELFGHLFVTSTSFVVWIRDSVKLQNANYLSK